MQAAADHLIPLHGDWALWRDFAVRSAGFAVGGLSLFGAADESARLAEIAADPAFREAVIWQNRTAFRTAVEKIAGGGAGSASEHRRRESVAAAYWQRYCSKNDTIGFFGPLAWAPSGTTDRSLRRAPMRWWPSERFTNRVRGTIASTA